MKTMPSIQEMQAACIRKDPSYDGVFFLAVRATGNFCRPSCPAREPSPENVSFYVNVREALFAGYRACKRCRPLDNDGRHPEWVERALAMVRDSKGKVKDSDLKQVRIDPAQARRYFQKRYGMTFQAFCGARRMADALQELRRGINLDEAALDNGCQPHGGFREAFARTYGRLPGASRDLERIVVSWFESPLGPIVAAANDAGVCLVDFSDRRLLETQFDGLKNVFSCAIVPGENAHLHQLKREIAGYFAGTLREFSVPLVYPGTDFQVQVWEELQRIRYGETCSYEDLARRVGSPSGQRAVGHANGKNRISIVIPCHRIVNKNGGLCGYGGGLWRKQRLLELEGSTSK